MTSQPTDQGLPALLEALATGVDLGHVGPGAEMVVEGQHLGYDLVVHPSPRGPGPQPLLEHLVGGHESQPMDVSDITALGSDFELLGHSGAHEEGGATGLGDARGHAHPRASEPGVAIARCVHLGAPENVGIEHHRVGQLTQKLIGERCLARPTGARQDEHRPQDPRAAVAAIAQDGPVNDRALV